MKVLYHLALYPFQRDMVQTFHTNRFSICKLLDNRVNPQQLFPTYFITVFVQFISQCCDSCEQVAVARDLLEKANSHTSIYQSGCNKGLCLGTRGLLNLKMPQDSCKCNILKCSSRWFLQHHLS